MNVNPQPLIAVRDVQASACWYQRLLGCESAHGGTEYKRLVVNGTLVLQLHNWEVEHHHVPIGDPAKAHGTACCFGLRPGILMQRRPVPKNCGLRS